MKKEAVMLGGLAHGKVLPWDGNRTSFTVEYLERVHWLDVATSRPPLETARISPTETKSLVYHHVANNFFYPSTYRIVNMQWILERSLSPTDMTLAADAAGSALLRESRKQGIFPDERTVFPEFRPYNDFRMMQLKMFAGIPSEFVE